MKAFLLMVVVFACFLAATGNLRGSLKDYMDRGPHIVEVQSPQSVAVEVRDGESEEVDNLATACGLVNRGKVGNLVGIFNFELDERSKVDSAVECLKSHPMVVNVEPQTLRRMVPKKNS